MPKFICQNSSCGNESGLGLFGNYHRIGGSGILFDVIGALTVGDPKCANCNANLDDIMTPTDIVFATLTFGIARIASNDGLYKCGKCNRVYCHKCCIH